MRTLALVIAATAAATQGQMSSSDVVLSGNSAYILRPPEVVAQAEVSQIAWSTDGKYLLMVRTDPPSEQDIFEFISRRLPSLTSTVVVWNAKTRKTQVLWESAGVRQDVRVRWLTGSHRALISMSEPIKDAEQADRALSKLIRVDADQGTSQELMTLTTTTEYGFQIWPSPVSATAVVIHAIPDAEGEPSDVAATIVTAQSVSKPGKLGTGYFGLPLQFDRAGQPFFQSHVITAPRKTKSDWYGIALDEPRMIELDKEPELWQPPEKNDPIIADRLDHTVGVGAVKKSVASLWLFAPRSAKRNAALISDDVDSEELSPDLANIAYLSRGVAIVRPVLKTPRKDVEEMLNAAERTRLISNGKQLAMAALMWAGDNDDVLPGAGQEIKDLLMPYCKNSELFEGFVYTFQGGPLKSVERISETEMGYIPGPGGRAIIYVDGHVKWAKD